MAIKAKVLKPSNNVQTLDRIRRRASDEYQRRIPEAAKAGIQETMKHLMEFGPIRNEFIDALVNRIGLDLVRNTSWTNPLKEFKSADLEYGDTVSETKQGLITATDYDEDRESLEGDVFGTSRPEVQSNFHRVNSKRKYKVTINNPLLRRAFHQEYGLTQFVENTMESITTSDEWDEFLATCSLFPHFESNAGFYKINVPDVAAPDSTPEDAKQALRKLRAAADNLTFMSTRYNAAGMYAAAKREDILLFVTPEFNAAIDVEGLAALFNITNAQLHGRIIPIPMEQLGIDGAQAIMTTKEFFVLMDQLFQTTSMYNPDNLQNNYWLHHWQIISASRFAPAILFTTKPGDEVIQLDTPVTSLAAIKVYDGEGVEVTDSEVDRGFLFQFTSEAITTPVDGPNDGVRWSITGQTSNQTRITQNGVLHVAPNEGAVSIEVTATSTWLDPEGLMRDGLKVTKTVSVVGPSGAIWPVGNSVTGITVEGVAVSPPFAPGTFAYTVVVPGGTTTADEVKVSGPDTGDVEITLNEAGDVVTISSPSSPGDPVYTVTVN